MIWQSNMYVIVFQDDCWRNQTSPETDVILRGMPLKASDDVILRGMSLKASDVTLYTTVIAKKRCYRSSLTSNIFLTYFKLI